MKISPEVFQQIYELSKRVEFLKEVQALIKKRSKVDYVASIGLYDGKGTTLNIRVPNRIILAQVRAEIVEKGEALNKLRMELFEEWR